MFSLFIALFLLGGCLKKISGQAADIATIALLYGTIDFTNVTKHIHQISLIVIDIVSSSIDSFINRDLPKAYFVMQQDDEVDYLFEMIKKKN